jgi:glycerol-3-phosphate dehydrogenase
VPEKIAVLGDGAWGTAVALLLAQKPDHRVCLWSAFEANHRVLVE